MAFRRRYARRSTRSRVRSSRRVSRRTSRRTTTRYRRTPRRSFTRRRILNTSSVKKQDNMLAVRTDSIGANPVQGPFSIPGTGAAFLWCATSRDRGTGAGVDPTASSVRERDLVYMRGLKENIIMTTNSAAAWRWRRLCFTCKGLPFQTPVSLETSSGWVRMLRNIGGSSAITAATDYIFKGAQNVDWQDVFVAKPDTNRIKVYYDSLRTLSSGNAQGRFFRSRHWYPMNQNLMYGNDENGENETGGDLSTLGRAGMGDYYVLDFFDASTLNATDTLAFQPEATLYWHER